MTRIFGSTAALAWLLLVAFSAPASAATPEECKAAVDAVSVQGATDYDSALEAELTAYLNGANEYLVQRNDKTEALKQLEIYGQKLDEGAQAKKISEADAATLRAALGKAMECIRSLE